MSRSSGERKKMLMGNSLIAVGEDTKMPKRDKFDFYPTSWGVIEHALGYAKAVADSRYPLRVLDVCAGSGRWGQVAKHWWPRAWVDGVELQKLAGEVPSEYSNWYNEDALTFLDRTSTLGYSYQYDIVCGNPAFTLYNRTNVAAFFSGLHGSLRGDGVLILFGRGAIDESAARYNGIYSWWKPEYEVVFVDRVSFYPEGHPRCGDTNATKHSLFVWRRNFNPEYTKKVWAIGVPNDDTYTGPFKGKNTWQDMIAHGLVKEEEEEDSDQIVTISLDE